MSWISLGVGLAGSVGLLLFGIRTAVEGARVAGGSMLVSNLWRWTCDRRRALLTGAVGGSLLPASGTLTETGYGLAGAGLVSSRHALWLMVGAGLGAVLAGSLVVVLGEGVALQNVALTVVTVGVALQFAKPDAGWSTWGKGLVGIGLAGVGLHLLGGTLSTWGAASTHPGLDLSIPLRTAIAAACGAALTWGLRSVTLALAAVLLACGAGLLTATSGLGWTLGIPIGLALRAIPTLRRDRGGARRAAVLHVTTLTLSVFLGAGGIACALPLLAAPPAALSDPMVLVSLFFLATQVTAACVMAAIDAPLVRWLEEQWPDEQAPAAQGGAGLFAVPELARQALVEDVHHIAVTTRDLARAILGDGGGVTDFRIREDLSTVRNGALGVEKDCAALVASAPPVDVAQVAGQLPGVARLQSRLCEELARMRASGPPKLELLSTPARSRLRHGALAALHLLESSDALSNRFSARQLDGELKTVEAQTRDLRGRLFEMHRQGSLANDDLEALVDHTDRLREVARIAAESGQLFARAVTHHDTDALSAPNKAEAAAETGPAAQGDAPTVVPLDDTALRMHPERMEPVQPGSGHPELHAPLASPSPFDPQPLDPAAIDAPGAPFAQPAPQAPYAAPQGEPFHPQPEPIAAPQPPHVQQVQRVRPRRR